MYTVSLYIQVAQTFLHCLMELSPTVQEPVVTGHLELWLLLPVVMDLCLHSTWEMHAELVRVVLPSGVEDNLCVMVSLTKHIHCYCECAVPHSTMYTGPYTRKWKCLV